MLIDLLHIKKNSPDSSFYQQRLIFIDTHGTEPGAPELLESTQHEEPKEEEADILDFSTEEHQKTITDQILAIHDKFAFNNREGATNILNRFSTTRRTETALQDILAKQEALDIGFIERKARETMATFHRINEKAGLEYARQLQKLKALGTIETELSERRDQKLADLRKARNPKKRRWYAKPIEWKDRAVATYRDMKDVKDARFGNRDDINADREATGFAYERQFDRSLESVKSLKEQTASRIKQWEKKFVEATKHDIPLKRNIATAMSLDANGLDAELKVHFHQLERPDFRAEKEEWRELALHGTLSEERKRLQTEIKEGDEDEQAAAKQKLERLDKSLEWKIVEIARGQETVIRDLFDRIGDISRAEQIRLRMLEVVKARDITKEVSGTASRTEAIRKAIESKKIIVKENYLLTWRETPLINKWTVKTKELFAERTNFWLEKIVTTNGTPTQLLMGHGSPRDAELTIDLVKGTVSLRRWLLEKKEAGKPSEFVEQKKIDFEANEKKQSGDKGKLNIKPDVQTFSLRVLDGITPKNPVSHTS